MNRSIIALVLLPEQRHDEHQEPPYLNQTAARLVQESIVSKPAEGEKQAADGSSDILAVALRRLGCAISVGLMGLGERKWVRGDVDADSRRRCQCSCR